MPLSTDDIDKALTAMELKYQTDGQSFLHAGPGNYAELISTLITVDDDREGAAIVATLPVTIPAEKRPVLYELMNLVHGQNIWSCRLHLDEDGRVLVLGKVKVWGAGFDRAQFSDVFFTVVVTTDRFARCLHAVMNDGQGAAKAFDAFFLQKNPVS